MDSPLNDPDTTYSKTLVVLDMIFSAIFTIEAIMKIIAFGFLWNQYQGVAAYLRNGWNILDFTVVLVSFTDIYYLYASNSSSSQNLSSIKALRAIRALRPLRMISKNKGLQIAIKTLFSSIPAMANVLLICILFLLIFAILGVSFFKGEYYYCDILYLNLEAKVEDWRSCLNTGGYWKRQGAYFDNVLVA